MPSAEINSAGVTRQVEKPHHYTYLKSFRTEQCKDFLNHRCNQHRPFTCFFWHFPNQKRRRPVFNSKDGTFNYSPDVYCSSYDESTGICPQGDSCPYLHRNIGDTEKRYHLRYYKTERCIIDTENKGSCTKNGPHCAFAHGPDDLRAPVFDITERNVVNAKSTDQSIDVEVNGEKEKEKIANIDPVWFDENYIKLFYKTEPCTRTSRHVTLSCPFYHNPKDRRRRHDIHKYRAVVCPEVKHKEEWTDPAECGLGDKCPYIHTRTEQQYHPDIYKTDKCHEEAANGRCSKGIFCAFAHDNPTMPQVSPVRNVSSHGENSSSNASQAKIAPGIELQSRVGRIKMRKNGPNPRARIRTNKSGMQRLRPVNGNTVGQIITNGMTLPGASSGTSPDTDSKWLGFSSMKLDPRANDGDIQSRMKQIQPMPSEMSAFYDPAKKNDYPLSMYTTSKPLASSAMPLSNYNSGVTSIESSFKAASLMPAGNDTHLMDRLDSLDDDDDNDHALLGMPNSGLVGGARMLPSEVPQMSIFNTAPTGTMPPRFSPFPTVGLGSSTAGLSLSSNVGFNYSLPGFAPSANGGFGTGQTSRLAMYGLSLQPTEIDRLKGELDDAKQIIQRLSEEKLQAIQERDLLLQHHHQATALSDSALSNGTFLRCLIPTANLEGLSVPYLQDIQVQLQLDLRRVQMAMSRQAGGKCLACLERMATTLLPCKHKSLCEPCLLIAKNCPLCGASIPDQQAF